MASSSSTLPTTTAATTAATLNLHFSPEWMRTGASSAATSKLPVTPTGLTSPQSSQSYQPNGPDSLSATSGSAGIGTGLMTPAPSSMQLAPAHSSNASQTLPYSSLLTPAPTTNPQSKLMPNANANTDPFRYSRDTFLSIWRAGSTANGGSGWRLGIEVERHDGVVVDVENTPACAKEMTEAEIKVYQSTSLNSRRPSISHGHSHTSRDGEPVGLGILGRRGTGGEGLSMALPSSSSVRGNSGGPASPLRERFPRRDSTGTSQPYRPRQLTNPTTTSSMDGIPPIVSPRTTSGGFGFGGGPGFDGVLSAGEGWGGRRRGPAGALPGAIRQGSFLRDIQEKTGDREREAGTDPTDKEKAKDLAISGDENPNGRLANGDVFQPGNTGGKTSSEEPAFENWEDDPEIANTDPNGVGGPMSGVDAATVLEESSAQKPPPNPAEVKWQYVDDQQVTQGPFSPDDLTLWEKSNWLRPDLRMNRPEYDTMFLPLSTWKAKMEETKKDGEDKGVFFTWFEPVHESKPSPPKVIQPPPGLTRHDAQPSQTDVNLSAPVQRSVEPPKPDTPAPSVFEVLRRAEHAPSPVFGEAGFSHSPVGSHRIAMKGAAAGLESTHASSPASSHANMYGDLDYAGVMRQPSTGTAFHQGMNYLPHNPLPTSLARGISSGSNSSPLVGYSSPMGGASYSAGGELGSLGMQPPYPSQAGSMYANLGMRKPSYEQFASSAVPWQGNVQGHSHRGSNLISGVAPTSSTTSSLSNVPRGQFGGRRSPSPAPTFPNQPANAGLTSSLGGEVYEGALAGSTLHTAIGRSGPTGNVGGGYSPGQQYGTLYRSPVPPIPEMSHGVEIANGANFSGTNDVPYVTLPQGHAPSAMPADTTTILLRKPSLEPMGAAWTAQQQDYIQQQQEQRSRLQPLDMQASLPDSIGIETLPEGLSAKSPVAKEETEKKGGDVVTEIAGVGKIKPAPASATPKEEEDDNSQPFIPVKKQHRAPAPQVVDPPPAPLLPASISASASVPTISQSSSKMTVPLASLITNPPPGTNPNQTPTTTAPAKAWATISVKDEAKGLKEIQEAEAKRARENERVKARPVISPMISPGGGASTKDEEVGTLMTWGLPTSLAGARASKDSAAGSSTTTPPVAVWTSVGAAKLVGAAGNGVKKATMKDIQEEEERRRKKEKDVVTVAKRVGEKAQVLAPTPTQATGGNTVWSTVGASGKVARPSTGGSSATTTTTQGASTAAPTGIAALPPRPSAAAIASSGMRAAHNNSTTSQMGAMPTAVQPTRRTGPAHSSAASAVKLTGKGSNGDDSGVGHGGNVSADTLKWMRETLKGKLVKGITVEEVVGLVLMMHEEDDIADTIYQSSPTLPGKRFAAEFMEKRRADRGHGSGSGGFATASSAVSARGGAGSAGSGAESAGARLQPSASASQDGFGFKVVKKKGKGGKA